MSHKSNEALKTIMLVKRWGHHTKSGGYSRLRTEIPHSKIIQPRAYSNYFLKKNGRRILNRVLPSARHINLYNIRSEERRVGKECRDRWEENDSIEKNRYTETQRDMAE